MRESRQSGFTLIEVLIASTILVPILFAIISTQDIVGTTMDANDRRADAGDQARRVARRLRQIVRPALLSTVSVQAMQTDVDAAVAAEAARYAADPLGTPDYIPTLGEWISPAGLDPRPNVQFVCAAGELAVNASKVTAPRSLEFRMDPKEADNDLDDDGDGIVDEGRLHYVYGGLSIVLLENVESCTFALDKGMLLLDLTVARRDRSGRIHRVNIQQKVYLRNN